MKHANRYLQLVGVVLLWMQLQPSLAQDIPYGKGILFMLEKDGSAPSYIFGTIHAEDKRVLQLPPPVRSAFSAADTVVLEMTMDEQTLIAASVAMLYMDGRDLPGVIGEQRYKRVVAAMAGRGVPEEMLRLYKPWSVATLLSMPPPKSGEFLDMMLYRSALEKGKKVKGLESVDEQLSIFNDLTDSQQIIMLDDALDNLEQLPSIFNQLMVAYLARDMDALVRISTESMQQSDSEMETMLQRRLVDERNRRMVERLQPLLQKGWLFVAVGALHLPGEKGVLRLLEEMGYRVTMVY